MLTQHCNNIRQVQHGFKWNEKEHELAVLTFIIQGGRERNENKEILQDQQNNHDNHNY